MTNLGYKHLKDDSRSLSRVWFVYFLRKCWHWGWDRRLGKIWSKVKLRHWWGMGFDKGKPFFRWWQGKPFLSSLGNHSHASAAFSLPRVNKVLSPLLSRLLSWVLNMKVEVSGMSFLHLYLPFPLFLRQGFYMIMESLEQARMTPQQTEGILLSLTLRIKASQTWTAVPGFFNLSARESKSGSYACAISTFLSESPP